MPANQIIFYCIVALAPIATIFAIVRILTGPRLISKLMLRYLMKRRIAWVSLIAVILCTAMVLIVISVMGGWLRMFRQVNHSLIGDLIVYRMSRTGFSNYDEMITEIMKIPEVKAATPTVHSYGLVEMGWTDSAEPLQSMVEVTGLDIKQIEAVNGFVDSLHLQKNILEAKADAFAKEAADEGRDPATRPSVGSDDDPAALAESFRTQARSFPSWDKPLPAYVYRDQFPNATKANDPAKWSGIIVGSGVIGLRPEDKRRDDLYRVRVKMTVLKVGNGESVNAVSDKTAAGNFWLIDDSRTGVYQVDQNSVYLPFDVLQKLLGMEGGAAYTDTVTDQQGVEPSRCNEIYISLKPGADLYAVKPKIEAAVAEVVKKHDLQFSTLDGMKTETWEERQHDFLNAVEHEESLLVILFAIISVVAVFLIFCIFFMIVMEKTRDIGIVKSLGATSASVAGIFLGYGLSIGLFGGGLGLLLAYLVVHNINQLHKWMGEYLHIEVWNAKTYLFDTIPNTMDTHDVVVIVSVAILASVLGALVPAMRAAKMNPIEALRWE